MTRSPHRRGGGVPLAALLAALVWSSTGQAQDLGALQRELTDIEGELESVKRSPLRAQSVRSPTYVEMLKLEQTGELTAAQRNPLVQPRPAEELYDLQSDPHELRNLIDQPAHQATVQRLRAALTAWQAEIDDPGPAGGSEDRFDRTTGKRLPKPLR